MAIADIDLVVTDLDNTLYDWVTYFSRSFAAMVDAAAPRLEVPREQLLDELRHVHQTHRNSEHPFALLETPTVATRFPNASRRSRYEALRGVFDVFSATRRATLQLYPGVAETINALRDRSTPTPLVAHTEATVPNALVRLRMLGIEPFFDRIFAVEPSGEGHPLTERNDLHLSSSPGVRYLRHDERKPDPRVLLDICSSMNVPPERTLYIGDSISRDIGMARAAGAWTAWARYGTRFDAADWAFLVRITHWTADDVARAERAREEYGSATPHVTLEHAYSEIMDHFRL